MKIAIIQFPGSNCESESIRAVRAAGMDAEEFLWNRNPSDLSLFDGYFIVGGFSYEDRSRAGIIASLDPIMKYLHTENEKGKPILGVCNGAQILVEAGFVPGCNGYALGMALAENKRIKNNHILGTGFYNAWVTLMVGCDPRASAFTCAMRPDFTMRVPVAHGEGRFMMKDNLLNELKEKQCTTFRYCASNGEIIDEFPVNPNGSAYNLAGVSNANGNCLALMPHPERTADGLPVFQSMRQYIVEQTTPRLSQIDCPEIERSIPDYVKEEDRHEIIVESIITDNAAYTVQTALRAHGINVCVRRYAHWEIALRQGALPSTISAIIASGELCNTNKERSIDSSVLASRSRSARYLVRYRDDNAGSSKIQTLRNHHGFTDIESIISGVLWILKPAVESQQSVIDDVISTNILYNPNSQICMRYYP